MHCHQERRARRTSSRSCRSIRRTLFLKEWTRICSLDGSRFFLNRHCIFSKSFLWTDKVVNRLRMFAHLLLTRWNVSFVRHRWIGWVVFERINYVVDFYSFFLLERKLIGALMAITKNRTKSIFFSSSSLSFWFRSHFDNLISLINYAIFELKFAVQRYKYNFNQHF